MNSGFYLCGSYAEFSHNTAALSYLNICSLKKSASPHEAGELLEPLHGFFHECFMGP